MITQDRYAGAHVGVNREMTPAEEARICKVAEKVATRPPWTPKKARQNAEFRSYLMSLYEDGVSSKSIAETLNWQLPRVTMHIRQARLSGIGTGTRRYIAPPERTEDRAKRNLTEKEEETLLAMLENLPRANTAKRMIHWKTKEGRAMLAYIESLQEDNVPMSQIAETIGMSRQALSLHVAKGAKSVVPDDVEPRSLTAAESKRLAQMYSRLEIGYTGARVWASEEGVELIDEIRALTETGVPVASIYTGKDKTSRIKYKGIDAALQIPPSAIGRMVSMRDKFVERLEAS